MIKFVYNNIKNTNTDYISFKLNYGYYLCISIEKNINSYFQPKLRDKLLVKLKKLMIIY